MVVKLGLGVFENRVLTKCRLTREKVMKVARNWRILHNVELHDLYSSPDLIWAIRSRRLR